MLITWCVSMWLAVLYLCIILIHIGFVCVYFEFTSQIAQFMGPTWGPPGADILAPWTLLSGFVKGIKNGCPCIVDIRGTQGCALVGDPARAVGECRDVAKAQP